MKRKATKAKPRKTWQARIAAESDIAKKELIAWHGKNALELKDPAVALAVEFYELLKLPRQPLTVLAMRGAWKRFRKLAADAINGWNPESFERFAKAMRRAKRGEFKQKATPREWMKWVEVISAHKSRVSPGQLAKHFPAVMKDLKSSEVRDHESLARHFKQINKRAFPER